MYTVCKREACLQRAYKGGIYTREDIPGVYRVVYPPPSGLSGRLFVGTFSSFRAVWEAVINVPFSLRVVGGCY